MTDEADKPRKLTRRQMLRTGAQGVTLGAIVGGAGILIARAARGGGLTGRRRGDRWVWQIDPYKCTQCGQCATECVLEPSAVKCVHAYELCGRCEFCFGYYESRPGVKPGAGAEGQLCPTGAIERSRIKGRHYEYTIDESKCIGCSLCVKGCNTFGNGSLHLQVRHDRCLNCNECAIAAACPADAFVRVRADDPYLMKSQERGR
jgi:electron transport complex protein RnfB